MVWHAAEYEEVTQMVINIIKKDFEYAKDIALASKQMIHIDIESEKPRPTMSENEDLDIKKIENEHLRMEYQMDLSKFRLRSRAYKANTMCNMRTSKKKRTKQKDTAVMT